MPSIKQTKPGGLGLPGTLLEQSPAQFRDNLNMAQDQDGVLYTRNGDTDWLDGNGDTFVEMLPGEYDINYVAPYIADDSTEKLLAFVSPKGAGVVVPGNGASPFTSGEVFIYDSRTGRYTFPQTLFSISWADAQISWVEVDDVFYFILTNTLGSGLGLYKYDGVKWHLAGLPRAALDGSLVSGAVYVRALYCTLDFKGNEVFGDYSQYQYTPAGTVITINPTYAGGALPFPRESAGGLLSEQYDGYSFDPNGNPTYNAGTMEYTIPATSIYLFQSPWFQMSFTSAAWLQNVGLADAAGRNRIYLIAMRVKSISGSNIIFDANPDNVLVYVDKEEWITGTEYQNIGAGISGLFNDIPALLADTNLVTELPNRVSNTFLAVFTSSSPTSGYILKSFAPVAAAGTSYTISVDTAINFTSNTPFNQIPVGSSAIRLEDVVDTTIVRTPFPFDVKYLAQQNGNLLAATDRVLFFSSTEFGSSPEMTDGLSNLVPGYIQDGLIKGIGATENFVFVSREKRNFSIIGNLATGNFEVQPYREPQPGTTDHRNIITVQDNVLFSNRFGVHAATASTITNIGRNIIGLFQKSGEQRLTLGGTDMGPITLREASYDETRNWVTWKGQVGAAEKVLKLNLNTLEFQLWSWNEGTLQFINGLAYSARPDETLRVEDPAGLSFAGTPLESYVVTSWIHLGEPSLEKQFTQIKWFMRTTGTGANVSVFKDWNESTPLQDSEPMEVLAAFPLSQKQKIATNKSLCISVSLEAQAGQRIEIEGYELEYNPIQEGMKR